MKKISLIYLTFFLAVAVPMLQLFTFVANLKIIKHYKLVLHMYTF